MVFHRNSKGLGPWIGATGLLMGWAFYIYFRGFDPVTGRTGLEILRFGSGSLLLNSFPSFIYSFSLFLLSPLFFGQRRRSTLWPLSWLAFGFLMESLSSDFVKLQLPLLYIGGSFDIFDLLATAIGISSANILQKIFALPCRTLLIRPLALIGRLSFLGFALILNVASVFPYGYSHDYDFDFRRKSQPIYLAYEDFRSDVRYEESRPFASSGKIIKYGDHLFVSEPFAGVHVFDNVDPENPEDLGFINIPGNTDIAIKNATLFANSYFDLVVIDLEDFPEIEVKKRFENIITYDPSKSAPNCITWQLKDVDSQRGVVTGCEYPTDDADTDADTDTDTDTDIKYNKTR